MPVATSVTVLPETVHTVVVFEAKLTGRPDDAVAEIVNGGVPNVWLGSGGNVMVWDSLVIVNDCATGVAAA